MADVSLKQRTIVGMIWGGIQKFGTLFISFLSNVVLARLLTPDDYGMIGMLAIFISVSSAFVDGGFGSALIQKTTPRQQDYTTVFYWNFFLSIVLYSVLFVASPLIESFYHDITGLSDVLRLQGLILIINSLTTVQFNILRKNMEFKLLAVINIVSATISLCFAIVLAYYGFGIWALVWQQIILSLSNVVFAWLFCRWRPFGRFSFESLKELFNFGSFIMLSSLINTIGNNINGLLIGKFFTPSVLGYFTQAKRVEDVSSLSLLTVVEQVSYPMLVEVKNDYKQMASVLAKFNSALLAITMPFLLFLFIVATPVVVLLFSDKWLPSAPILQILAVHGIFIVLQGANYNAIAAIGRSQVLFRWTVIKRCFGIIVTVSLMLLFEFNGFLWGVVTTGLFIALCNMYLVAKYINYPFFSQISKLLPVIVLNLIPFIGIWYIELLLNDSSLLSQTLLGFIYLLIYFSVLWFVPIDSIRVLKNYIIRFIERKK